MAVAIENHGLDVVKMLLVMCLEGLKSTWNRFSWCCGCIVIHQLLSCAGNVERLSKALVRLGHVS